MIKLVLPEDRPPEPERVVHFEFRRHKQAGTSTNRSIDQAAYLVGREPVRGHVADTLYPVKIDGDTKTVEIRRDHFEKLGFQVVVK